MADMQLVLACIIQGEGGALGYLGMHAVAATLATRLAEGQSLERIDREYYGNDADKGGVTSPNAMALELADLVARGVIRPSGHPFCMSKKDVERHGWKRGDVVLSCGPYELHLYARFPEKEA